ncbi:unnamed protein product, partial [Hapterophycus canaliculatus]
MSALLDAGANIHADCDLERTPLHAACLKGHPDAADLLLRRGADELFADEIGVLAIEVIPDIVKAPAKDHPRLARLFKILNNAPQDRVWRRRGFLVMCRAFLDRVRLPVNIPD